MSADNADPALPNALSNDFTSNREFRMLRCEVALGELGYYMKVSLLYSM